MNIHAESHAAAPSSDRNTRLLLEAVEQSPVTVIITDRQGRIEYANAATSQVTGFPREELLGENPRIWKSGLTPRANYEDLWQTISSGAAWTGELVNRRRNGELFVERLRIVPVRDSQGQVARFLAVGENLTSQREAESRLRFLLSHDPLTGLPNRDELVRAIDQRFAGRDAAAGQLAVLFVGLDRFRAINAGFGRASGDTVLGELVARLKAHLRREDSLARVGGDEFALVVEAADSPRLAYELAGRILAQAGEPFRVAGREVQISCSIGLACAPEHGCGGEQLLQRAMSAMLTAKDAGRNAVRCYADDTEQQQLRRLEILAALRQALVRDELFLEYQPQVDLTSGEIIGAEALLRWRHPERGLIPPGDFIPLAEETDLIVPLGCWALREACRQAAVWRRSSPTPPRIAVNLSSHHFHRPELSAEVRALLEEFDLDPPSLELELTETAMMYDTDAAIAILRELKAIGVRVALDDFGTGFSSLAYLSRLPLDVLKIDRSFVSDVTTNPVNAAIARTTIAMAHSLGLRVVAEGIETEGQLSYLTRQDCDAAQGYLLGRPVSAGGFGSLLRGGQRLLRKDADSTESSRVLLLVDDEPNILKSLWRLFRRDGYRVLTAQSGEQALAILAGTPVQVVVSDQRMPSMNGTELLSRVKDLYPDTVRIVLSGFSDLSAVTEAINRGAIYKYLSKPWKDEELRDEVRHAFRKFSRPEEPRALEP